MLVIFGASGDLTKRKIFPALYALQLRHMLPERFAVLGSARTEHSDDEFRTQMAEAVSKYARDDFRDDVWGELAARTYYVPTEFGDDEQHNLVAQRLTEIDKEHGTDGNRLYYLAVPPKAFPMLVEELGDRRTTHGWTRVIVEKPFGHDLESARELNALVTR